MSAHLFGANQACVNALIQRFDNAITGGIDIVMYASPSFLMVGQGCQQRHLKKFLSLTSARMSFHDRHLGWGADGDGSKGQTTLGYRPVSA